MLPCCGLSEVFAAEKSLYYFILVKKMSENQELVFPEVGKGGLKSLKGCLKCTERGPE